MKTEVSSVTSVVRAGFTFLELLENWFLVLLGVHVSYGSVDGDGPDLEAPQHFTETQSLVKCSGMVLNRL